MSRYRSSALILALSLLAAACFAGSPTDVSDLKAWYKADSLSLSDGDPVGSWSDSSGNGLTATATGTQRPTFKTSILNGQPIIRFNSAASTELIAGGGITLTQPDAIVVVAKVTSKSTHGMLVATDSDVTDLYLDITTGYPIAYAGTVLTQSVDQSGAFHIFNGNYNGGSSSIYIDGTSVASGNAGSGAPSASNILIGRSAGGLRLNGDIAEILIYDHALTSDDRVIINCYFKAKYNITIADTCPATNSGSFFPFLQP